MFLRLSVAHTKEAVGSREFVEWNVKLDERESKPGRADYRSASIVQAVSRVLHKHPQKVKIEDCVVRYTRDVETPVDDADGEEELTEHQEQKQELKQAMSKVFWGALTNTTTA